jgi:hypothetical protein
MDLPHEPRTHQRHANVFHGGMHPNKGEKSYPDRILPSALRQASVPKRQWVRLKKSTMTRIRY